MKRGFSKLLKNLRSAKRVGIIVLLRSIDEVVFVSIAAVDLRT